MICNAYLLIM